MKNKEVKIKKKRSNQIGTPTIVCAVLVIFISFTIINGSFSFHRNVGRGHSFNKLMDSGMSRKQAVKLAEQDGLLASVFMIFGLNVPITLLILIVIGLISKTIGIKLKRKLRLMYLIISLIGAFVYSFGIPYYQNSSFPLTFVTSLFMYFIISILLWTIIGIGILIRGKQNIEVKQVDLEKELNDAQQKLANLKTETNNYIQSLKPAHNHKEIIPQFYEWTGERENIDLNFEDALEKYIHEYDLMKPNEIDEPRDLTLAATKLEIMRTSKEKFDPSVQKDLDHYILSLNLSVKMQERMWKINKKYPKQ